MSGGREYELTPLGECAVKVIFAAEPDAAVQKKIKALGDYLNAHPFKGYQECIASYTACTVLYDPFIVVQGTPGDSAYFIVTRYLDKIMDPLACTAQEGRLIEIPVCYGGEYGPDLEYVADYHHLTTEAVVKIHTDREYLVHMLGFCPGFPYLGGMDERLATPRRAVPRLVIPARSVGIAGRQTGAYPLATPGGWQIIGRSAIELFTPRGREPSLLAAGDRVRFRAVSKAEYKAIRGRSL